MFEKLRAAITDDNEMPKESQRFTSLACLFFAFLLTLQTYHKTFLGVSYGSVDISPGAISGVFAIAMIAPLYLRGLLKWNRSIFSTISFVLILGVFASFVELTVKGKGLTGSISSYMLLLALALSWLGLRGIAGMAWVIVLVAGIYSFLTASGDLGFWGFLYICSAFAGLCFHSGLNPGEFFTGLKEEYSSTTEQMRKVVVEDMTAAKNLYGTNL